MAQGFSHKPLSILIITGILLLEPLFKTLFYAFYFDIEIVSLLKLQIESGMLNFCLYFFLYPLAGISVFIVKKWSYYIFITIILLSIVYNIFNLHLSNYSEYHNPMLFALIVVSILNIAVVGYFLSPAIKLAYMDPRIRWWEAKPRYDVGIDCTLNDEDKKYTIKNISESGCFLAGENLKLVPGSAYELKFDLFDIIFKIKAEVIHHFTYNDTTGYGLKFCNPKDVATTVRPLVGILSKLNFPRRPEKRKVIRKVEYFLRYKR